MSSTPPNLNERIERLRSRLKDIVWAIRAQYGHKPLIDRMMPFVTFDPNLSDEEFDDLFHNFPKRVPARFGVALLPEIRSAVYQFRDFRRTGKQYHRAFQQIVRLEELMRAGPTKCELIPDDIRGYTLRIKSE